MIFKTKIIFFRNGKFAETGQQFYFPDDVNLGYIIGKLFLNISDKKDFSRKEKR